FSTRQAVEDYVLDADLVIGAVLVPGAAAPKLITRQHVEAMQQGSVIVDISIDQGGSSETSRPTTHAAPTYVEHGVVHYCVTNMPGAVARTSTFALNNATLPFILALAAKGPSAPLPTTHTCWTASTSTPAASRTPPSPPPSGSPTGTRRGGRRRARHAAPCPLQHAPATGNDVAALCVGCSFHLLPGIRIPDMLVEELALGARGAEGVEHVGRDAVV